MIRTLPRGALTAAAVVLCFCTAAGGQGRPPTPVHVDRVLLEELQEQRRVTGELRAVKQSRVATIEQGLVVEMPVDEGDVVSEGDVLAVLDARRLTLAEAQLVAQVRAVEALVEVRLAERNREEHDLEVLTSVSARAGAAPKELEDARAEAIIAAARHEQAQRDQKVIEAQLDLVRTRIDDMTIRAPFDGVVVATHTERGQWLGEGDAIVDLLSTGRYEAWLEIPQRYATALDRDGGVQVLVDATNDRVPDARPKIVPVVDPRGRMFSAHVTIEDEANRLKPGMSVTGWIPTGERRKYLTIDRDALMRNEAGFFVYVARSGSQGPAMATPVSVTYLFETSERVAVESLQITPGDPVVVEGNERLFPMMPVAPIEDAGPGAAAATAEED